MSALTRSRALALAAVVSMAALAAGCGGSGKSGDDDSMAGMHHTTASPHASGMDGMDGMDDMPAGDGLSASSSGFTMKSATTMLPPRQPTSYRFTIETSAGRPVTSFEPDQTKLMHLYLIRSDLTGFQHLHPTMAADGTWTADLAASAPGSYQVYASFIARNGEGRAVPLVLSRALAVAGAASLAPVPPAATSTQVDGYTVTASGDLMAGMSHTLTLTVAKGGKPVTDLQPYLETYAHLTAFHENDLAFAHLHPRGTVSGDHGGPTLTFEAMLPRHGRWRVFVQFQTAGVLHTAALTLSAG